MTTLKTFTIAGTTRLNGKVKARFANSMDRIKTLVAGDHTDITLVELPNPMTKLEAVQFLRSTGFGSTDPEINEALAHVETQSSPNATKKAATQAKDSELEPA